MRSGMGECASSAHRVRLPGVSVALSPVEVQAWQGLLRTHAALVTDLDRELRAAHGLPLSSYIVLHELAAAHGRLRMGDLANRAMLTRPGLSGLVDRLEHAGLVERRPCDGDARGTYAAITEEGGRKLERAEVTHGEAVRRRCTGRLTEAQLGALGDVWCRLLDDRPPGRPDKSAPAHPLGRTGPGRSEPPAS